MLAMADPLNGIPCDLVTSNADGLRSQQQKDHKLLRQNSESPDKTAGVDRGGFCYPLSFVH